MAADAQQVKKDEELTRIRNATVRWAECLCGHEVELKIDTSNSDQLTFGGGCECGRNLFLHIEILG